MSYHVLSLIVDYNTTEETARLSLDLAAHQSKQNKSGIKNLIIHIDNGSSPPVQLTPSQIQAGVQLVATQNNLGYAGALNFAIRHIEQKYREMNLPPFDAYWFLNSDLEIESNSLSRLTEVLETHPKVGAVGPLVYTNRLKSDIWGSRGCIYPWLGLTSMSKSPLHAGLLPRWSYIPGCSLLVKRSAYESVHGLPEAYKLYFEETEFCLNLQKSNWQLWLEPSAIAYHASLSKKDGIPARHFAYYFVRNNLMFWKNNFNIPIAIQLPRTFFVMFKEVILPLRKCKNFSTSIDRLYYALAGFWDGILFALEKPTYFEKKLFPSLSR